MATNTEKLTSELQSPTKAQLERKDRLKDIQQGKNLPEDDYAIVKLGYNEYVMEVHAAFDFFKLLCSGAVEKMEGYGDEHRISEIDDEVSLKLLTKQRYALGKMNKFFHLG